MSATRTRRITLPAGNDPIVSFVPEDVIAGYDSEEDEDFMPPDFSSNDEISTADEDSGEENGTRVPVGRQDSGGEEQGSLVDVNGPPYSPSGSSGSLRDTRSSASTITDDEGLAQIEYPLSTASTLTSQMIMNNPTPPSPSRATKPKGNPKKRKQASHKGADDYALDTESKDTEFSPPKPKRKHRKKQPDASVIVNAPTVPLEISSNVKLAPLIKLTRPQRQSAIAAASFRLKAHEEMEGLLEDESDDEDFEPKGNGEDDDGSMDEADDDEDDFAGDAVGSDVGHVVKGEVGGNVVLEDGNGAGQFSLLGGGQPLQSANMEHIPIFSNEFNRLIDSRDTLLTNRRATLSTLQTKITAETATHDEKKRRVAQQKKVVRDLKEKADAMRERLVTAQGALAGLFSTIAEKVYTQATIDLPTSDLVGTGASLGRELGAMTESNVGVGSSVEGIDGMDLEMTAARVGFEQTNSDILTGIGTIGVQGVSGPDGNEGAAVGGLEDQPLDNVGEVGQGTSSSKSEGAEGSGLTLMDGGLPAKESIAATEEPPGVEQAGLMSAQLTTPQPPTVKFRPLDIHDFRFFISTLATRIRATDTS